MFNPPDNDVTKLLASWSNGDQEAFDELLPLIYEELRRMAKRYMNSQPSGHTLQTTALIHEAYLKLTDNPEKNWQNRAHFFAVAAQAMRHILVDHARKYNSEKRGGSAQRFSIEDLDILPEQSATDLLELNDALQRLEKLRRQKFFTLFQILPGKLHLVAEMIRVKFFDRQPRISAFRLLEIRHAPTRRKAKSKSKKAKQFCSPNFTVKFGCAKLET